jgi:hypothetical protein
MWRLRPCRFSGAQIPPLACYSQTQQLISRFREFSKCRSIIEGLILTFDNSQKRKGSHVSVKHEHEPRSRIARLTFNSVLRACSSLFSGLSSWPFKRTHVSFYCLPLKSVTSVLRHGPRLRYSSGQDHVSRSRITSTAFIRARTSTDTSLVRAPANPVE